MGSKNIEVTNKNVWLYSVGSLANNLVFMFVSTYVMFFYTNVLGISAIAAGSIFMVARLIDAVTDPVMGMLIDRTNSKRWGKYRGYITFGAPLLGIVFILMFTKLNIGMGGRILYAYIAYIVYSLVWTVVQIPYLALPIILSNDVAKRTRIVTITQACGAIGSMVISSWALQALDHFGGQENPTAWRIVTITIAVITTALLILAAYAVKNLDVYAPQVKADKSEKKLTIREQLKSITKNVALISLLVAFGTDQFAYQISNSLRIYFFRYNMGGRTDLIVYLGYVGTAAAFLLIFLLKPYVQKLGKRKAIVIIESAAIVATLPIFLAPNVTMVMTGFVLLAFIQNTNNMISRSTILDCANYSEYKLGIKSNALISSTFTFINKCAQAFSAFFAGAILQSTGYDASLTRQNVSTEKSILYLITIIPIIAYICSIVAMKFYPMNRSGELEMQTFIENKRMEEAKER